MSNRRAMVKPKSLLVPLLGSNGPDKILDISGFLPVGALCNRMDGMKSKSLPVPLTLKNMNAHVGVLIVIEPRGSNGSDEVEISMAYSPLLLSNG